MTRRYPTYRDSGVDWLGDVPSGWDAPELKRFACLTYGDALASEIRDHDGEIPVYGSNGAVGTHSVANGFGPVILIGRKGSYGALNWCDSDCFAIDTVYLIDRRFASCDLRWLFWALHLARFEGSSQDTGVPGLSRGVAHQTRFPLPPLPEQTAIAAFLDRETAKIDALVAEQRRLIDLLREKRQAIISHAVTKGLNRSAPLKPSGIEWLGDVPAAWKVKKVSAVCERMTYGFTNPMPTTDEGPFLLTAADINDGAIAYETARHTSEDAFENLLTDKSRPIAGDVLITKDGTLGRVAVADGTSVCINQSVALLRLFESEMRPLFLACLLSGSVHKARMLYEAGGTTIKHIYISRLAQMPIPVPSVEDQVQILNWLNAHLPQFDDLISEGLSALSLLDERRAALISAAVTGKIDVRHLAPQETEAA